MQKTLINHKHRNVENDLKNIYIQKTRDPGQVGKQVVTLLVALFKNHLWEYTNNKKSTNPLSNLSVCLLGTNLLVGARIWMSYQKLSNQKRARFFLVFWRTLWFFTNPLFTRDWKDGSKLTLDLTIPSNSRIMPSHLCVSFITFMSSVCLHDRSSTHKLGDAIGTEPTPNYWVLLHPPPM